MPLRKAKASAFNARLRLTESERDRIVGIATKSQVNLARLAYRIDQVQSEIRALSRELKLLEMPETEE
jgi:hypothetical protein